MCQNCLAPNKLCVEMKQLDTFDHNSEMDLFRLVLGLVRRKLWDSASCPIKHGLLVLK